MDRRAFILGGVSAFAAPLAAEAQPAGKVPRIGFIEAGSPSTNLHFLEAFRRGLHQLGYVEGQSIAVEDRWANGQIDRFAGLLDEVLRLNVNVIVQASTSGAIAAQKATTTVPVVFWGVIDPVGVGLVTSLARPGGNMTGLALDTEQGMAGKWAELFKEILPGARRIGAIWNSDARGLAARVEELARATASMGLTLEPIATRTAEDLDRAFAALAKSRVQGLIVLTDPMTLRHRVPVVQLAARTGLPAMYGFGEFVRAGGLMAYGPSVPDLAKRAAIYVDKILKGAKAGDLPVELPTIFELVINLKTAKALGLTIPRSLLLRADQVIE